MKSPPLVPQLVLLLAAAPVHLTLRETAPPLAMSRHQVLHLQLPETVPLTPSESHQPPRSGSSQAHTVSP